MHTIAFMKDNNNNWYLAFPFFLLLFASCHKEKVVSPIVNHWGCETYVRWETDSLGLVNYWDTLHYEVGVGHGYEVFFYSDGTGKLILNESPAFINTFTCDYQYDADRQVISIQGDAWLYALYGTVYLDENYAEFQVETLNDTCLIVSWKNEISEPKPFYERFFLKVIYD